MIFIGNFLFLNNQEQTEETERRHGEFNMIVKADNSGDAIAMFKERILDFKAQKDFFTGKCSIFFTQLLEFEGFPGQKAMMLNFKSISGDPVMPYIACSLPSEEGDWCRIFNWNNNTPEIDGKSENLFLEFEV